MSDRIYYNQCPACYSDEITDNLKVADHTVSHELYEVWKCNHCSLLFTQNIPDQHSIGRYYKSENYISHSESNIGIVNRLYRIVRRFTLRSKKNTIQSVTHLSGGELLDLGAGSGAFASYMQQSGWIVTALEPDEQARKKAWELYSMKLDSSEKLFNLDPDRFDVITLWHVIEHVHLLHEYIDQLKKLLTPGGVIFIAVPNHTSYDAILYREYWAALDVPRHLYHFSPGSMRNLLQKHGLALKKIKPMWFDSFYVSLLSEKYKSGRSNLLKGFWNGGISNAKALFNTEKASSLIYIISK